MEEKNKKLDESKEASVPEQHNILQGWDSLGSTLAELRVFNDSLEEQLSGERHVEKTQATLLYMAELLMKELTHNTLFHAERVVEKKASEES